MEEKRVFVFNIQHYSLQDGPGIRTTVFLQGCPLRCRWCCNPESQEASAEKNVLSDSGRFMSVDEILNEVEKDIVFYRRGGGGLTVSGGEPLLHGTFTLELLKKARERYLTTAIETCGAVEYELLYEAAKYTDTLYYDIKSMNEQKHREWTGCSNRGILHNLERLVSDAADFEDKPRIIVRTPVIPGFNDTQEELLHIAGFLKTIGQKNHEMLRYHRLGKAKYESLGREYPMGDAVLSDEKWKQLSKIR